MLHSLAIAFLLFEIILSNVIPYFDMRLFEQHWNHQLSVLHYCIEPSKQLFFDVIQMKPAFASDVVTKYQQNANDKYVE